MIDDIRGSLYEWHIVLRMTGACCILHSVNVFRECHKFKYWTPMPDSWSSTIKCHDLATYVALFINKGIVISISDEFWCAFMVSTVGMVTMGPLCRVRQTTGQLCWVRQTMGQLCQVRQTMEQLCRVRQTIRQLCQARQTMGQLCRVRQIMGQLCRVKQTMGQLWQVRQTTGQFCFVRQSTGQSCRVRQTTGQLCQVRQTMGSLLWKLRFNAHGCGRMSYEKPVQLSLLIMRIRKTKNFVW